MGSQIMDLDGAVRRGSDIPGWNPHKLVIVGLDIPYTDAFKGLFCPRAAEPIIKGEDDEDGKEFVDSIRKPNRVYDTIHAVKYGKGKDGQLYVAAHRRCVKGARIIWDEQAAAGIPEAQRVVVRVQIHDNLTPEQIYELNVDENGQKKDLSPLQRAEHYAYAASVMKLDQRTIARKFKVAQSAVSNALAMLKCAPSIVERMCLDREDPRYIAPQHAATLAALPPHEQEQTIEAMKDAGIKPTGENVRATVQEVKKGKRKNAAEGKKNAPVKVEPKAVTNTRSRGLVEKVLGAVFTGDAMALDAECGGELTERDRAIIAMTLSWVTGKDAKNAEFAELAEACLGSKKDDESGTEF